MLFNWTLPDCSVNYVVQIIGYLCLEYLPCLHSLTLLSAEVSGLTILLPALLWIHRFLNLSPGLCLHFCSTQNWQHGTQAEAKFSIEDIKKNVHHCAVESKWLRKLALAVSISRNNLYLQKDLKRFMSQWGSLTAFKRLRTLIVTVYSCKMIATVSKLHTIQSHCNNNTYDWIRSE